MGHNGRPQEGVADVIGLIVKWLAGGALDRVLKTVDNKIAAETDREALKRDLIVEHYRQRADWMRAGGFWLMVMFAGPLALWWASVLLYSALWCRGCIWPQAWTVAALPAPLDEWAGMIVLSIFGVIGLDRFKK